MFMMAAGHPPSRRPHSLPLPAALLSVRPPPPLLHVALAALCLCYYNADMCAFCLKSLATADRHAARPRPRATRQHAGAGAARSRRTVPHPGGRSPQIGDQTTRKTRSRAGPPASSPSWAACVLGLRGRPAPNRARRDPRPVGDSPPLRPTLHARPSPLNSALCRPRSGSSNTCGHASLLCPNCSQIAQYSRSIATVDRVAVACGVDGSGAATVRADGHPYSVGRQRGRDSFVLFTQYVRSAALSTYRADLLPPARRGPCTAPRSPAPPSVCHAGRQ